MKLSDALKATQEAKPDTNNNGTQTVEIEYSFFAKVNVGELLTSFIGNAEITHEHFIEGNLTHDPSVGKMRLRHYPNDKTMPVTKLELKNKVDLNTAIETATDLPESFLKPLLSLCSNVTARVRFYVPVKRTDGSTLQRRDGTLLMWQVDFFINNLDPEDKLKVEAISEWVKIELEVDHDTLSAVQVGNMIPFEYQHLIDARSKDDSERNLIDSLYSTVYNLSGRGTLPEPKPASLPAPDNTGSGTDDDQGNQEDEDDDDDFDTHLNKTGGAAPTDAVEPNDAAKANEPPASPPATPDQATQDNVDGQGGDEFNFQ